MTSLWYGRRRGHSGSAAGQIEEIICPEFC